MRIPRTLGTLLLAIWLILFGVLGPPLGVSFAYSGHVLAILAIVTGVVLILQR
jgi:hypothetical protein